jgi:hypothetical protein
MIGASMLSFAHDVVADLFKTRPSLAAEILVEVLGISLPAYTEARLVSVDLTEIAPAEYRADVVVLLLDGDIPVRVIVVEVQLAKDPRKRRSWPAYVCVGHAMHGCLVDLLVIAPDPDVATWCAQPIPLGPPGFVLTPPVLRVLSARLRNRPVFGCDHRARVRMPPTRRLPA